MKIATLLLCVCGGWALLQKPAMAFKHEQAGDILQFVVPAVGLGATALEQDMDGIKQFSLHTAATLGATYAMKLGLNSTPLGVRPNGKNYSFPSGHTSMACAGASYIGQRYGWKKGMMAMVPAGYVGWTRVHANKHHTRDVLVGCSLAIASSFLLVEPKANQLSIQPWYENSTLGLSIRSTW